MPLFAVAQKSKEIKPVKMHTVGPKESLSSIGRMYEVNGRVLANYNNIEYEKGINIGQVLKIPPKGTTLDQVPIPTRSVSEILKKEEANPQVPTVKEETKPVEKTEKEKPVITETVKKEPEKKTKEPERTEPAKTDVSGKSIKGGAFRSLYESQNGNGSTVNEEGSLGVFKSTSGWNDGKYYCLYNNAVPGTVIKVSTPAGKFVYAKVLDLVPDLKQNNGLLILISNAAADELGVGENNTNCSISYSK